MKSVASKSIWLWFAFKGEPLRLDHRRYKIIHRVDGDYYLPEWTCLMPNRGIHVKKERFAGDVYIIDMPESNHDISRTQYGLNIVRTEWYEVLAKEIRFTDYVLSSIYCNNVILDDWKILSTRNMPRLRMERERVIPACSNCGAGEDYWGIEGKAWLDIRDLSEDEIFATPKGIFIRSDIFEKSGITAPRGSFENPEKIEFN